MSNPQPKRIPEQVKWFIIEKKRTNFRPTDIIDLVKTQFHRTITFKTIDRLWTRYCRTGSLTELQRSGRPKIYTQREERKIAREFLTNPGLSVKQYVKDHQGAPHTGSRRTLSRTLRRRGLVPKVSERGKEITRRNKGQRVRYAKKYLHWRHTDWRHVVFSDEATIYPCRTRTSVRWALAREANPPPEENLPSSKSINVWAYITYDGDRGIFPFTGNMEKVKYRNMLEEHLFDAIEEPGVRGGQRIFQQDGASYHTCPYVTDWLEENDIECPEWPPQGPDLNIIENVWATLKNELFNRRDRIRNKSDLWAHTEEIFYDLTLVYIRKLYHDIPQRLQSVIKVKGNRTRH